MAAIISSRNCQIRVICTSQMNRVKYVNVTSNRRIGQASTSTTSASESKSKEEPVQGKRVIFNSRLALLQPPDKPYDGEWPKKPPYWQIYGTSAAKGYWKILAGLAAFSVFTGSVTAHFQPKISLGIFDRYLIPEMFYDEDERKEKEFSMKNAVFEKEIKSAYYIRQYDQEIPTKELRKRIDSLEVAVEKEKPYIHSRSLPLS
uniref:Uncharacterized protein n=1 Tax=Tetranychus urticae TaxID=32264 RepID=T1KSH7_TETUR